MNTEEIIRRLGKIKLVYPAALGNAIGEAETTADLKALTAAIQAVTALEGVNAEAKGNCRYCKFHAAEITGYPCRDCTAANDQWEFRWPLGGEAEQ